VKRRIIAFVVVLGVAFGAGAALGAAVGPIDVGDDGEMVHQP